MEIHQQLSRPTVSGDEEGGINEDEDLIQQCIEVIRSEQRASVSLLQRRLRLGYTRAARIMDELENRGIVGPSKGAEPRDILIDWMARCGRCRGGFRRFGFAINQTRLRGPELFQKPIGSACRNDFDWSLGGTGHWLFCRVPADR
jgi:hypothetical protein